jgi:secondary thiamine-phosphate synthase enzyme
MESFNVSTGTRTEFVNITRDVVNCLNNLDIEQGLITVFVPHTTAAITINENADPDVMEDVEHTLEKLVPWNAGYRHSEGNAAAHVKATLVGPSVQIVVEGGRLQLGTWQGIYFCEFDGPRSRKVWVSA